MKAKNVKIVNKTHGRSRGMFVGLPFEYLNLFFHLLFQGDKGTERNCEMKNL